LSLGQILQHTSEAIYKVCWQNSTKTFMIVVKCKRHSLGFEGGVSCFHQGEPLYGNETVNDLAEFARLAALGVDGVFTDDPGLIRRCLT